MHSRDAMNRLRVIMYQPHALVLSCATSIIAAGYAALAVFQHRHFLTYAHDLGIFDHGKCDFHEVAFGPMFFLTMVLLAEQKRRDSVPQRTAVRDRNRDRAAGRRRPSVGGPRLTEKMIPKRR